MRNMTFSLFDQPSTASFRDLITLTFKQNITSENCLHTYCLLRGMLPDCFFNDIWKLAEIFIVITQDLHLLEYFLYHTLIHLHLGLGSLLSNASQTGINYYQR